MKNRSRYFGISLALVCTASCSSIPKYSAYDGETGYWDQVIAPSAYQVFVQLPKSMSVDDRDHYLLLRVGELCEKEGSEYFHMGPILSPAGQVATADFQKVSMVGFCSKQNLRPTLNLEMVNDGGATVADVINTVTSKVLKQDVIVEVAGEKISDTTSLKLALHKIGPSVSEAKLKIIRAGKALEIVQPIERTNVMFGPQDYKALKYKFL